MRAKSAGLAAGGLAKLAAAFFQLAVNPVRSTTFPTGRVWLFKLIAMYHDILESAVVSCLTSYSNKFTGILPCERECGILARRMSFG